MFPIPFNFPFRKKDGSITTMDDAISSGGGSYTLPTASAETKGGVKIGSGLTMDGEFLKVTGGGGSTLHTVLFYSSDGTRLLDKEYVLDGDNALFNYCDNQWASTIGGDPIPNVTTDITNDLTLYYVGNTYLYYWDFTKSKADQVNNALVSKSVGVNENGYGLTINDASQYIKLPDNMFDSGYTILIEFGDMDFKGDTSYHETLITFSTNNSTGDENGLIFKHTDNYWTFYNAAWEQAISESWTGSDKRNIFANKTLALVKANNNSVSIYLDGVLIANNYASVSYKNITLGNGRIQSAGGQCYDVTFKKFAVLMGNPYT